MSQLQFSRVTFTCGKVAEQTRSVRLLIALCNSVAATNQTDVAFSDPDNDITSSPPSFYRATLC